MTKIQPAAVLFCVGLRASDTSACHRALVGNRGVMKHPRCEHRVGPSCRARPLGLAAPCLHLRAIELATHELHVSKSDATQRAAWRDRSGRGSGRVRRRWPKTGASTSNRAPSPVPASTASVPGADQRGERAQVGRQALRGGPERGARPPRAKNSRVAASRAAMMSADAIECAVRLSTAPCPVCHGVRRPPRRSPAPGARRKQQPGAILPALRTGRPPEGRMHGRETFGWLSRSSSASSLTASSSVAASASTRRRVGSDNSR